MCAGWISFAKDGDPSTDEAPWAQYAETDRATMIYGDDGSAKVENDPLGEQRELMESFAYYYLK